MSSALSSSTRVRPGQSPPRSLRLMPVRTLAGSREVVLTPGPMTIGSADDCSVVLKIPGIAPRHVEIQTDAARSVVSARDPRCWLNDGLLGTANLRRGDRLAIGPLEFRVEECRAAPPPGEIQGIPENLRDLPATTPSVPDAGSVRDAGPADPPRPQQLAGDVSRKLELIHELLAQLQAHSNELRGRERSFDDRIRDELQRVVDREQESQRRSRELDDLRGELQTLEAGVEQRRLTLREEESRAMAAWEEIRAARHELELREDRFEIQSRDLDARSQRLAGREEAFRQQVSSFDVRGFSLKNREDESRLKAEQGGAERRCGQEQSRIAELEAPLQSRQRELDAQAAQLQRQREHLERTQQAVSAARQQDVALLQDVLREQREMQRRQEACLAHRRELENRQVQTALREAERELHAEQLRTRAADLAAQRTALASERSALQTERDRFEFERSGLREWLQNLRGLEAERAAESGQLEQIRAEVLAQHDAVHRLCDEIASQRRVQLEASAHAPESARRPPAEIAAGETAADDERRRLAQERAELESNREQILADREDLLLLRSDLETDREALAAARREFEERQHEFQNWENELRNRSAAVQNLIEVVKRERTIAREQQRENAAVRQQVENASTSLEAERSAMAARRETAHEQFELLKQQEQKLIELLSSLDAVRHSLNDSRDGFEARLQSLQEQRADVESQQQALAECRAELAEQQRRLEHRTHELQQREAESAAERRRLHDEQDTFRRRQDEFLRELETLSHEQQEIERLCESLEQREAARQAETERLQELRNRLDGERQAIDEERRQLAAERDSLLAERSGFDALQAELDRRQAAVSKESEEIERKEADLRRQVDDFEKNLALRDRRERELDDRTRQIAQRESAIDGEHRELCDWSERLASREEELAGLLGELEAARNELRPRGDGQPEIQLPCGAECGPTAQQPAGPADTAGPLPAPCGGGPAAELVPNDASGADAANRASAAFADVSAVVSVAAGDFPATPGPGRFSLLDFLTFGDDYPPGQAACEDGPPPAEPVETESPQSAGEAGSNSTLNDTAVIQDAAALDACAAARPSRAAAPPSLPANPNECDVDVHETGLSSARYLKNRVSESNAAPPSTPPRATSGDAHGGRAVSKIPGSTSSEDDIENPDTIAAYMERLLGKKVAGSSAAGSAASSSSPSPPPGISPLAEPPSRASAGDDDPAADESGATLSARPSRPRSAADADSIRTNLISLRKIANVTARRAIATSTRKKTRGSRLRLAVLAAGAIATFAVLAVSSAWTAFDLSQFAWQALAVGMIATLEFARSVFVSRRLLRDVNSGRKDAGAKPPAGADREVPDSPAAADA